MTALRIAVLAVAFAVPAVAVKTWVGSAEERIAAAEAAPTENAVAVAAAADEAYCNPELKRILRRVLQSCGLIGAEGSAARGCQPVQAKNVATVSGDDFNALFQPMKERGGIVQFDVGKGELDPADMELIDKVFAEQKGASWFFVVARASPEGSTDYNRELSRSRAESVMTHLRQKFNDPDLDKEVGLLWLGEEFAQLDQQFCEWRRSAEVECKPEDINRSAFIAWIDCRL
jgi:outer membrane protein OmpA-like peptidoglycan-associated protein